MEPGVRGEERLGRIEGKLMQSLSAQYGAGYEDGRKFQYDNTDKTEVARPRDPFGFLYRTALCSCCGTKQDVEDSLLWWGEGNMRERLALDPGPSGCHDRLNRRRSASRFSTFDPPRFARLDHGPYGQPPRNLRESDSQWARPRIWTDVPVASESTEDHPGGGGAARQ